MFADIICQKVFAVMKPEPPSIIRRRVNFDFGELENGRWTSSKGYFEDVLNVISYFFPIGEQYFIESVQHYEDRITDPVLKTQVKDFIYQEAMHSKQHARSNVVLDQMHTHGDRIARISEIILYKSRWFTPKSTQLAITCAIEHFTALLSNYLLSRLELFLSISNSSFGTLWAWHAVEETEHKAVCFDLYQHIFGKGILSYLHRVAAMAFMTVCFLTMAIVGIFILKKGQAKAKDGGGAPSPTSAESKPNKQSSYTRLWRLIRESMSPERYFEYYKYSFHPWDYDNSHLVEEWKRTFPEFGTRLEKAGNRS